jgi:hypothetical protein
MTTVYIFAEATHPTVDPVNWKIPPQLALFPPKSGSLQPLALEASSTTIILRYTSLVTAVSYKN